MPSTRFIIEVPDDLPLEKRRYLEEVLPGLVGEVLDARERREAAQFEASYRALVDLFAGDVRLKPFEPGS